MRFFSGTNLIGGGGGGGGGIKGLMRNLVKNIFSVVVEYYVEINRKPNAVLIAIILNLLILYIVGNLYWSWIPKDGSYPSSEREREIGRRLLMFSKKLEFGQF